MMKVAAAVLLVLCLSAVYSSPIAKKFKEAEYEFTLKRNPGEKSYFIKNDELPIYQQQFARIKELGEEISCKITGNCEGSKRGLITKKSLFGDNPENEEAEYGDQMNSEAMGGMGGSIGGEDVSAMMEPTKTSNFMANQKDASMFGQQPQMDIKMTPNEMAALKGGMGGAGGGPEGGAMGGGAMGAMGGGAMGGGAMGAMGGGAMGGGPMEGVPGGAGMAGGAPQPESADDQAMKMQEQNNAQLIDNSVQDKLNFMDKANGPIAPLSSLNSMGGLPGNGDPFSSSPPNNAAEGKEVRPEHAPGGVSENDLLKAEDIQPNEMKGIDSFLKDSNRVEKNDDGNRMISDGPNDESSFTGGKTNVDFGGSKASIDNNEAMGGPEPAERSPMNGGPLSPGGPEVPTLMNLGLGMNPAEMGGMGPPNAAPNLNFIQDSTRQMIQQNSDYKVPQPALSSLWNSYMSSTQSVLGDRDPSANSRHSISRPEKSKLHRRSNVEKVEKASINEKPKNKNFVYVPAFVIRNVIRQVKKSLKKLTPKNATTAEKSKSTKLHSNNQQPALSIQEKQGKRYLVINPDSPLIQGFANVDDQFSTFQMPNQLSSGTFFNMNGSPSIQLPTNFAGGSPFGAPPGTFPATLGGPMNGGMKLNGLPLLGGQTDSGGLFRGYVAVPIATRLPLSGFSGFGRMGGWAPPSHQFFPSLVNPFSLSNTYQGRNFGTPISPDYQPTRYGSDTEFQQPIYRSNGPDFQQQQQQQQQQQVYGNQPLDYDYEPTRRRETTMDDYHSQNIDLNEDRQESSNVNTGYSNEDNYQNDHFAPVFEGAFGGRSPNYEENYNSNARQQMPLQRINGDDDISETSKFVEENFRDRQMPFERNLGIERSFKRSGSTAHTAQPIVFTKEHVGFGPITVEAHTASYKGDDPKQDEQQR